MTTGLRAARVYQGIAVMDLHHGQQWVWGVDPDTLDMSTGCGCVIGQTYPSDEDPYYDGTEAMKLAVDQQIDGGFFVDPHERLEDAVKDYAALTRIWAYAIRRLREQRPQEVAA